MPPDIPKRERLDAAMDGKLESYVRARRKNYRSWDDIAFDIRAQYGADVTGESLRRWFGEPKTEAVS